MSNSEFYLGFTIDTRRRQGGMGGYHPRIKYAELTQNGTSNIERREARHPSLTVTGGSPNACRSSKTSRTGCVCPLRGASRAAGILALGKNRLLFSGTGTATCFNSIFIKRQKKGGASIFCSLLQLLFFPLVNVLGHFFHLSLIKIGNLKNTRAILL